MYFPSINGNAIKPNINPNIWSVILKCSPWNLPIPIKPEKM